MISKKKVGFYCQGKRLINMCQQEDRYLVYDVIVIKKRQICGHSKVEEGSLEHKEMVFEFLQEELRI